MQEENVMFKDYNPNQTTLADFIKNAMTQNENTKLKERIDIQKTLNSIVDGSNLEISEFLH